MPDESSIKPEAAKSRCVTFRLASMGVRTMPSVWIGPALPERLISPPPATLAERVKRHDGSGAKIQQLEVHFVENQAFGMTVDPPD